MSRGIDGKVLRRAIIGILIGVAAFTLALWGVPLDQVADALGQASIGWLVPAALVFLAQQGLRAWRQAVILRATHPEHRLRTSLSVLCVSFFFINVLPARLGELSRPLLLLERDRIPLGTSFALVFVERAIDLTAMFVMIALVAWTVPVPSHVLDIGGYSLDWVALGRTSAGIATPALLVVMLTVMLGGQRLLDATRPLATHRHLGRLFAPVNRFGEGFVSGVRALRSPRRITAILLLTALTWSLTGWMYPLMARAFGLEHFIGYGEGVGLLSITMLGMTVPSAPGFAGTYEAFLRAGLALFGVSGAAPLVPGGPSADGVALAYVITFHWWLFLVQSATAVVFLVWDRISVRRLWAELQAQLRG